MAGGNRPSILLQSLEIKSEKKKALIDTIAIYDKFLNASQDKQQDLRTKVISDLIFKYGDESYVPMTERSKNLGLSASVRYELAKRSGIETTKLEKTALWTLKSEKKSEKTKIVETAESEVEDLLNLSSE